MLGSAVEFVQDIPICVPGSRSFPGIVTPVGFEGAGGDENTDAYAVDCGLSNPDAVPIALIL